MSSPRSVESYTHYPCCYPGRALLVVVGCIFTLFLAEITGSAGAAFELDGLSTFVARPADLAGRNCLRCQLGHHLPFGLRELSGHQLTVAISRPRWGLGTGLSLRGLGGHRETSIWMGAGLSPMSALSLGSGIHLLQLRQGSSPAVRALTLSAGVRLKISNTRMSVWLRGPAGDLAQPRLLLGVTRILDDGSSLQSYLTQRRGSGRSSRLHLGLATPVSPRLSLLLGARSAPTQFVAGARAEVGAHFLEYHVDTHVVLGSSHTALVGRGCGPSSESRAAHASQAVEIKSQSP